MLVWINGPFGGGKTAAACELARRVERCFICDPELLGFGLHGMVPPELRTNFQHSVAWRDGVHEVLNLVARKWDGPVIVPMTLINLGYFEEVVGRLRTDGHNVRHFSLLADRATVLRRLRGRAFGLGVRREAWAVARLDECLAQLQDPLFAEHVQTGHLSVLSFARQADRRNQAPTSSIETGPACACSTRN